MNEIESTAAKVMMKSTSDSDSSEEEDEVGKDLTDDVQKDFFRTLCFLKKKDPKIYDKSTSFFKERAASDHVTHKVNTKTLGPVKLRDYERNLLIEHGGNLNDEPEESNVGRPVSPSYVEEQQKLKESFHNVLNESSECEIDSEDKLGGLFEKCHSTTTGYAEGEEEDKEYLKWLKGHKDNLQDKDTEKDLKFLHDYWNNPSLGEDEKFLRDYILNKRFLEKDNSQPVDYTQLCEEEKELEEQTVFEHKYNYRYEQPDREFIKRYPRIMTDSLRRKSDKRKEKREEVKNRKLQEKEKKTQELRRLKNLKKKEVLAKIEELKTLTGNQQLAFDADIEDDFDADKHDRLMDEIFNEDFYAQDDPNFNQQNVEKGLLTHPKENESPQDDVNVDLHCEDPDFVMDCDYKPEQTPGEKKKTRCRMRKDKHKIKTFSEIVDQAKPLFDPETHETFEAYLDEYFDIDCEDFIGDLPCRYKYSETVPNSYGLTIEEILAADDKELDRWCSMKRISKLQPEYKELNDLKVFEKRGQDEMLKRKILPSLYKNENNNETEAGEDANCAENAINRSKKKRKRKKKSVHETSTDSVTNNKSKIDHPLRNKKRKHRENEGPTTSCVSQKINNGDNKETIQTMLENGRKYWNVTSHKTKVRNGVNVDNNTDNNRQFVHKKPKVRNKKLVKHKRENVKHSYLSDARLQAYGIKPKKFKNKLKYGKSSLRESWT